MSSEQGGKAGGDSQRTLYLHLRGEGGEGDAENETNDGDGLGECDGCNLCCSEED